MLRFVSLAALLAAAAAEPQLMIPSTLQADGLVKHWNGAVTPMETPAVAMAKANHLAAKTAFFPYTGIHMIGKREAEPQLILPSMIQSNGLVKHWDGAVTPMETPAVAMAKAQHFAAKGAFLPYTGIHMIGKREAEPQFMINSPFYNTYTSSLFPLTTYNTGIHMLGKREAEEKKAEDEKKVLPLMTYGMPLAYNTMTYNTLPYAYSAMPIAKPMVAHWNGAVVPMDTAEVAKAKMEHLEAKVEEYKKNPELKKMVYTAPLITKLWKREAEEMKEEKKIDITYAGLPVEPASAWIKKADGITTYKMPIATMPIASTYGMPLARTIMPTTWGYNRLFL